MHPVKICKPVTMLRGLQMAMLSFDTLNSVFLMSLISFSQFFSSVWQSVGLRWECLKLVYTELPMTTLFFSPLVLSR